MFKKFLILNIFLLFSLLANAEEVKNILVEGNQRVSKQTIQLYGGIDIGKDYTSQDLDRILKNLYETEFFEDVSVDLTNNTLKVIVREFPVVNQLIIVGEKNKKYKEEIKKLINLKEKKSFIKSNLAEDVDRIKKLYASIGFNFIKVETKVNRIDNSNLDLIFIIEKGKETKISSINFIGDKKIKSNRLRSIIASEEDKFWKIISRNTKFSENLINLDLRLLSNYYKSLGFKDVQIESNLASINKEGNVDLVYSIEAGQRYSIQKISTNLDTTFDKKIFLPLENIYQKYIGDFYSPFKIKKILEEIDEIIDKNNLQFVEHNVEESLEGKNVNIVFNIFEGEKFLVERIDISGNTITNEDVIRGELLLDEGDPFTNLALEKSIAEIKARNIFGKVDYKVSEGNEKNLKKIDISIEEKPTGEISAGAGVGTNGGTFLISVKENNWLGEGKQVGVEFEVDNESILGTISYSDPNYDFLGNSISYRLSSEENDKPDQGYENSIQSFRLSTSFEQFKDVFATLGLSAAYDDLRTDNSASSSLKKQSGTFSEIAGNYAFTFDSRNRAFMPTSGSVISFGQAYPFIADRTYLSNTFSASGYKSFTSDIVGATKFYFSSINGLNDDDVRLSKRKGLSSRRLRGFEKNKIGPRDGTDHIGGNYVASLNFEANLPNLLPEKSNTDVSLFLDFGNVWGVDYDDSIDESNKIRSSTGIAASWLSPIGPMTFTLSQNLSKADSDETESFNFNLGTTF